MPEFISLRHSVYTCTRACSTLSQSGAELGWQEALEVSPVLWVPALGSRGGGWDMRVLQCKARWQAAPTL